MYANGKVWGALDTAVNPNGGAQPEQQSRRREHVRAPAEAAAAGFGHGSHDCRSAGLLH
jgi:hypothetical protein